jgi:hypothetical protein
MVSRCIFKRNYFGLSNYSLHSEIVVIRTTNHIKGQLGAHSSRLRRVRGRVCPLWVLCMQPFPATEGLAFFTLIVGKTTLKLYVGIHFVIHTLFKLV